MAETPGFQPDVAVVALGSNLASDQGSPGQTVLAAIERLRSLSTAPLRASSLWLTAPVDCPPDAADFVNAVVILQPKPEMTARELLQRLHLIEQEFQRQRSGIVNAPRSLDLDLIAFGKAIVAEPGLTLPHPRASERRFVLGPLAEIAPALVLPGQEQTVSSLLRQPAIQSQRCHPIVTD